MAKAFINFHLNLAFSSIDEPSRKDVIKKCYWPLLKIVANHDFKIGIELTGWTLDQILKIDPNFIEEFRLLLNTGKCELIGSGWVQMIGPLAPYQLNLVNQKFGIETYEQILGVKPNIALVNEMAFSSSMVDIYLESGYKGILMDKNNIRNALNIESFDETKTPTHAISTKGKEIPVLWSDFTFFQRFQRFIHQEISQKDYLDFVIERKNITEVLPIYTNDAEIFNFRPGRFGTEKEVELDEWQLIENLFCSLEKKLSCEWLFPSEALNQYTSKTKVAAKLTNINQPIPVKKQFKYNINRWSLTGRNDLYLNTACHKTYQMLIVEGVFENDPWRQLCENWSSDFRTHIGDKRWNALWNSLGPSDLINSKSSEKYENEIEGDFDSDEVRIFESNDGFLLNVITNNIRLILKKERGLTIKELGFESNGFKNLIGTLPQGYFNSVSHSVDFYSGGVFIEDILGRIRYTDLSRLKYNVYLDPGNSVIIQSELPIKDSIIEKSIKIDLKEEKLAFRYDFGSFERPLGVVRVGMFSFLESFLNKPIILKCFNGGDQLEEFNVDRECDHSERVSSFVSSNASFGQSGGLVTLENDESKLNFSWKPYECAASAMLLNKEIHGKRFMRLIFSLAEMDDTSKAGGRLLPFEVELTHNNPNS